MNIFIVGGTSCLGMAGVKEIIARGHFVKSIDFQDVPDDLIIPREMIVIKKNFFNLSNLEIKQLLFGCDAVIFAVGINPLDKIDLSKDNPFEKYYINPIKKIFPIAKEIGIHKFIVFGSHLSYFAKKRPELKLPKYHRYIYNGLWQERVALSFADKSTNVIFLEFPFIFGIQKNATPDWSFLIERVKNMKLFTKSPKGILTAITIKQAGQFIVSALEKHMESSAYPIGYYNLSWKDLLTLINRYTNKENRKVILIPRILFKLLMFIEKKKLKKNHLAYNFNLFQLDNIVYNNLKIETYEFSKTFDVSEDNIEIAIGQSVRYALEKLSGRILVHNKQE